MSNNGSGTTGGGDNANDDSNNRMTNSQSVDAKKAFIYAVKQQYRQIAGHISERDKGHSDTLDAKRAEQSLNSISFADLVQCACFPATKKSKSLKNEIQCNLGLMTQYEWIVRRMSIAASLEQVAASTESKLLSRTTEQFDLQIKPDKSNSKQAQLLLSMLNTTDANYPKGVFLHCVSEESFEVIHFANVLDGQAQIIVEEESSTFQLLTSPNTKLYLC